MRMRPKLAQLVRVSLARMIMKEQAQKALACMDLMPTNL